MTPESQDSLISPGRLQQDDKTLIKFQNNHENYHLKKNADENLCQKYSLNKKA